MTMEINIKNNYGPVIDNHEGGIVNLSMNGNGEWERKCVVEAEVAESEGQMAEAMRTESTMAVVTLNLHRQEIIGRMEALVDRGDWKMPETGDKIKQMLKATLGVDGTLMQHAELTENLWRLLESGRGDRVRIVWQNLVGYLDEKGLLNRKGSPALNKDFFGDDEGYANIDKGRPSNNNMSAGFSDVVPLLDAFVPR